jgi:putative effector of murein hydrolase
MSFLGGIMKSLVNPMSLMQLAMGPAGWASLAMKTIGSQIAMQVIQKLGQQLGLPQPMIDMAQAAFANASGQPGLARQNIREAV